MKIIKASLAFAALSLGLLFPTFVSADTVVSGQISEDTTWSPAGGAYLINSGFSVAPGVTLTIDPGTVIKGSSSGPGGPSIYGRLVAHGTSEAPIYFTSFKDDSVGGDSGNDGPSAPAPGDWQGLYFKAGSEGDFDYVNVTYAGYGGFGYGNFVGIENDGGTLNIKNSRITENYLVTSNGAGGFHKLGFGIRNKGVLSVSHSVISDHRSGILSETGTTTLTDSVIQNNFEHGFFAAGEGSATFINNTFAGNNRTAFIDASKDFVHSGNTSTDLQSRGFEIAGNAREGAILHSRDLPILVGGITVDSGNTLTIEPGSIIKIGNGSGPGSIVVYGTLIARGTPENKIYFTSFKDDSVGGDSNGDGEASIPGQKNWNAIFLEAGSKAEFDNTVIRYSGFNYNGEYMPGVAAAIYNRGSELSITNSFIGHNFGAGVFQDAGTTTINKSELTQESFGILFRNGSATISESSLFGHTSEAISNQSGPLIDARNNWWGHISGPSDSSTSTPTGTGDRISGEVSYIPFLTAPPSTTTVKIDPVIIIPGIMGSAYKNGQLVIDPILHTYDDLIKTLDENGYTPGTDLFTFPYEWRDSNALTANLLEAKISEVKVVCGCGKVDLVAHSMGGLVARQYIQSFSYSSRQDVDKLIFLGTPHNGSPKSYLQWEGGQNDLTFFDQLNREFFTAEALKNGHLTIFDYIHNRPILSVQELLPTFNYLKDKNTGLMRTYPNNYPKNYFLESLNANVSKLLNSGVKITNFVGNSGADTIEKIRVVPSTKSGLWQDGEPEGFGALIGDDGLERGVGDNTVPRQGSILANIESKEIVASHGRIPTLAAGEVFKILTGKDATNTFDSGSNLDPKVLIIQLLSPIDFVVTAPDGKKIGKNFSSGAEYDEIPGAFYSGYSTDNEYITILNPQDGEYKVETVGTGNGGAYGILTSYVSDGEKNTVEVSGTTLPNEITKFKVSVIDGNTIPVDVDLDSPNTSTITISSPESRDYLRSEKINIAASSKTGVLSLSLSGKSIPSGTVFDPFYSKLGTTTLFATSSIGAKAVAVSSTTFRIIANYDSTISDINRAFSLGWIYNVSTKNNLLSKINKAVKGEEKIDSLENQKVGAKKITKIIEKTEKKIDKALLKALRIDLDAYKKDKINEQAYNIIKEDLEWLINN